MGLPCSCPQLACTALVCMCTSLPTIPLDRLQRSDRWHLACPILQCCCRAHAGPGPRMRVGAAHWQCSAQPSAMLLQELVCLLQHSRYQKNARCPASVRTHHACGAGGIAAHTGGLRFARRCYGATQWTWQCWESARAATVPPTVLRSQVQREFCLPGVPLTLISARRLSTLHSHWCMCEPAACACS